MSSRKTGQGPLTLEETIRHDSILVKGARVNNLKNITVRIPRKKLVVITGVSGSGKSSLAFDTLYAEGQRRYVESLNSYARQFLARMEKPDVDYIQGISPALAIEQKAATGNPRSTVGTTTEIYDYLRLLFARIGQTYSPVSGEKVSRDSVEDVTSAILKLAPGTRVHLIAEVKVKSKSLKKELETTLQKGFSRIWVANEAKEIETLLEEGYKSKDESFQLVVDRYVIPESVGDDFRSRVADSVESAYHEGLGTAIVDTGKKTLRFSEKFERDGMEFEIPSENLFSFNNPYGACKKCEGFGRILGIDEDLVIPDKTLSLHDGAVACWKGEKMGAYLDEFITEAGKSGFPVHRPWYKLNAADREKVWEGIGNAWGIRQFFAWVETQLHKVQYRVMLARYRGYTTCPECKGSRIRKDAAYVKIDGWSIGEFLMMEIRELKRIFGNLSLSADEKKITLRILREINSRLEYLDKVGLGYLTLNRKINTLSGGEMQRIRLSSSLGSGLVGSLYILDEPSIGLHAKDTDNLTSVLKDLRDQGNSVIVVEHDESIIRSADHIIDIGPGAGELGGEVVFEGSFAEMKRKSTLTAAFLTGKEEIQLPERRRKKVNSIQLKGAAEHNLKGVDAEFPLQALTVVTGVSGSGKTTLIKRILFPALQRHLQEYGEKPGIFNGLEGALKMIKQVEMVDQSPVGRSARSNPATYIQAWDAIRDLYSSQPLSSLRGFEAGHFSFNVDGGRCEMCKGDGQIVIEMQFLPDITLTCETCKGRRFKNEILDVKFREKNIDDVLRMTLNEAHDFFEGYNKITSKLEILIRVGLGYLRMGQNTSTLSGGEAQRLKLAYFLSSAGEKEGTVYIFDEPTTGLHFDDIRKLLFALNQLVEKGNTVIVIEHNLDVIKCADWLIDMGPDGGDKGGEVLYQGVPEGIIKVKESWTGKYLKEKLR